MRLALIAAMSENHVIGNKQKLPWHIPEDLKRFKQLTSGHPVIMGRKTFESIGCKPLKNRTNVVVSRTLNRSLEGVRVVLSVDEALKPFLNTSEEVFIAGGGSIYEETIGKCDIIYLTLVHKKVEGDAHFPIVNQLCFDEIFREEHLRLLTTIHFRGFT